LEYLVDGAAVSTISIGHFIEVMLWDVQTLVAKAGANNKTLPPAMASDRLQQYMQQSLEVLWAAFILNGNVESTILWFKSAPIATFGGRTPADLVADGRTNNLLRYIHSLTSGYSG
jgi:hypothetical protein